MAGEISGFFQCPRDKIDVIPNGVEAARFDRLGGVDLVHFRHAHVLPSEQIVFNVGRVVYEKGAQVLLKAMPRILAQEPSVKVMIAGKGPELESLHSLARSLNLEGKVLFPGYISDGDRDRFFRIADCAVFPSLYEPFGIVALEAMAAKCPLVVTKVGGFKDMIRHNEMGFTVYPGDPVSLARGVVHMLQHREQAAMCVEKAHRLVREEYNWERIAKRTADVCRRITAERAAIAW
jgi:glycogen(starch) synthase